MIGAAKGKNGRQVRHRPKVAARVVIRQAPTQGTCRATSSLLFGDLVNPGGSDIDLEGIQ